MFPPEQRSTVIGAWAAIGGGRRRGRRRRSAGCSSRSSWRLDLPRQRAARADRDRARAAPSPPRCATRGRRGLPSPAGDRAARRRGLGLLTLGLTQGPHWGWDEPRARRLRRRRGARGPSSCAAARVIRRRSWSWQLLRVPAFALAGLSDIPVLGRLRGPCCSATSSSSRRSRTTGAGGGPRLRARPAAGGHNRTSRRAGSPEMAASPPAFGAVGGFVFAAGCLWFDQPGGRRPRTPLSEILPGQVLTGHRRRPDAAGTSPRPPRPRCARSSSPPASAVTTPCRQIGAALGARPRGWRSSARPHRPTRSTRSPPAGCSWRSPRCWPGSPCCRWLAGGSSIDWPGVTSDEIREPFLSFFEARDHRRTADGVARPGAARSVRPAHHRGHAPAEALFPRTRAPPHHRLTTCQKCFRTPTSTSSGRPRGTSRSSRCWATFVRRLLQAGRDRVRLGAVARGLQPRPRPLWVTVFEGDEELGLGPDEEAIEAWVSVGVPRERIVGCPRRRTSGRPARPARAARARSSTTTAGSSSATRRPPRRRERALPRVLEPRVHAVRAGPGQHADAAAGAEHRHRARAQPHGGDPPGQATSVFETDQFRPLIELGEELQRQALRRVPSTTDRALRILADHSRGCRSSSPTASCPSNEDRGYVLRRLMRRAILQGRRIGIEPGFMPRFAAVVRETMGAAYPELHEQADTIDMWLRARGGGVRPDARAGHADPPRAHRPRQGGGRRGDRRGRGVPAPRHLRLPVRPHARAGGRAGAGRRRRRASRT